MDPRPPPRRRAPLADDVARALGPAAAGLAALLAGAPDPDQRLVTCPHGTVVGYADVGGHRRRVLEIDREGTPLAALRWSPGRLEAAWLRIPDGNWLAIEPRATSDAPWGLSDRLRLAHAPGATGDSLTLFEALDYGAVDRVPALADPGRLPSGGGAVVLNLLAALAADQGRSHLQYRGPYPGEQLFLTLLESFRYEPDTPDALTAFVAGTLAWRPAPHERLFAAGGVYVQQRQRIEKVVWRGRTYYRPDWQQVARQAPRRVRDVGDRVRCSLWALGGPIADHLELAADGAVLRASAPAAPVTHSRRLPAAVAAGAGAIVAATSMPALAGFVREEAAALALEWISPADDLVETAPDGARLSAALRERLAPLAAAAGGAAERAAVGLGALVEIAGLLGDGLRARAQARIAALPAPAQAVALTAPPPAGGEADARAITAAVQALLDDAAGVESPGAR